MRVESEDIEQLTLVHILNLLKVYEIHLEVILDQMKGDLNEQFTEFIEIESIMLGLNIFILTIDDLLKHHVHFTQDCIVHEGREVIMDQQKEEVLGKVELTLSEHMEYHIY